jgi:hypothetical protein
MRGYVSVVAVGLLVGCATAARIDVPPQKTAVTTWQQYLIGYQINYSQPKPGFLGSREQLPLTPLAQAELSAASRTILQNLPNVVAKRIPAKVVAAHEPRHYTLVMDLVAREVRGPTYAERQHLSSIASNLVTLGFASADYKLIADFDVRYRLLDSRGGVISDRSYQPQEQLDHEHGDFELVQTLYSHAALLLERHVSLTLDDFFSQIQPGR